MVNLYSNIKMMHGPIRIRLYFSSQTWVEKKKLYIKFIMYCKLGMWLFEEREREKEKKPTHTKKNQYIYIYIFRTEETCKSVLSSRLGCHIHIWEQIYFCFRGMPPS